MVKGIRAYDEKERRKIRRETKEKRDLRYPKRGRSFNPYTEEFDDQ